MPDCQPRVFIGILFLLALSVSLTIALAVVGSRSSDSDSSEQSEKGISQTHRLLKMDFRSKLKKYIFICTA